jgi:hypothetical protein
VLAVVPVPAVALTSPTNAHQALPARRVCGGGFPYRAWCWGRATGLRVAF